MRGQERSSAGGILLWGAALALFGVIPWVGMADPRDPRGAGTGNGCSTGKEGHSEPGGNLSLVFN